MKREIFLIEHVPLSRRKPPDIRYWALSKDGVYRVRDAYRLISEIEKAGPSSASDTIWLRIWKAHIPPKVRMFLWRVSHDILPTKNLLWCRHISSDKECPRCDRRESIEHVLLECPWSQAVWKEVGLTNFCDRKKWISVREWVGWCLSNMKAEICEQLWLIAWSIWKARNDALFRKENTNVKMIVARALRWLQDFKEAGITGFPVSCKNTHSRMPWQAPATDCCKINVDAACVAAGDWTGIGFVGRNHQGAVKFGGSRRLRMPCNVELAEALAMQAGVETAITKGLKNVHFEGDSQVIIRCLVGEVTRSGVVGMIIEDIKALCLF